ERPKDYVQKPSSRVFRIFYYWSCILTGMDPMYGTYSCYRHFTGGNESRARNGNDDQLYIGFFDSVLNTILFYWKIEVDKAQQFIDCQNRRLYYDFYGNCLIL